MMKQQQEAQINEIEGLTTKGIVKFQLRISDFIRHLYNPRSKRLALQLRSQPIKSATLYEKQLDQPLSWYKKTFAYLANIKTKHQFVGFQLQSGILGSIDFYLGNRVVLRLGDIATIIEKNEQGKRKNSVAVSKNETPYKINMNDQQKNLNLGDLIQIAYQIAPENGYSQIKFNGSHFSRLIMKQIKKQKKGKQSIIRSKLVNEIIGFEMI